ncbi:site-specific integrase, partial [Erysipelatoclostridium sp. MSK.7.34]|nr:site-specific integrase [Erysipelatoclostridium sp. MSK.7.34]
QTLNRYSHMFPSKEGEIVDKIDNQASIYNSYSVTLANIIVDFLEKINQLKNLEEKDIIMIEQIKKIM